MFLLPFLLLSLSKSSKIFPSRQNNSTLIPRKINFTRSFRRRRFPRFGLAEFLPRWKRVGGDENWSVVLKPREWKTQSISPRWVDSRDTASSYCAYSNLVSLSLFLSVTFGIDPISLKRADYVQVFEFDYSIRILPCVPGRTSASPLFSSIKNK